MHQLYICFVKLRIDVLPEAAMKLLTTPLNEITNNNADEIAIFFAQLYLKANKSHWNYIGHFTGKFTEGSTRNFAANFTSNFIINFTKQTMSGEEPDKP